MEVLLTEVSCDIHHLTKRRMSSYTKIFIALQSHAWSGNPPQEKTKEKDTEEESWHWTNYHTGKCKQADILMHSVSKQQSSWCVCVCL